MSLINELEEIRERPDSILTEPTVIALDAFLHGYRHVDRTYDDALQELREHFRGPAEADGCTRAYLQFAESAAALQAVINTLIGILQSSSFRESVRGPAVGLIETIRGPILSGRPGVIFGEPTVSWLGNFTRGFMAGLRVFDRESETELRMQFNKFESLLRERYDVRTGRWDALIRVFEGSSDDGLLRFINLWDELV